MKASPGRREGKPSATRSAKRPGDKAVRRPRPAVTEQKRPKEQQEAVPITPDVVYIPPKPFSRNRLILGLAIVSVVVIAVVLSLSLFFKVDTQKIVVSGNDKYSAWQVFEASGIQNGEGLLTFSRARAAGNIRRLLPYVKEVRIGIKLPDTVNIEIVEVAVTYAVKDQNDSWWLLDSGGRVVEPAPAEGIESVPKILGVHIEDPQAGSQAVAFEPTQTETGPDGALLPVPVKAAQRLSIALDITGYLETNGIIGQVKSIDVNSVSDIQLWYERQYQVKLGDKTQLAEKIATMKSYIDQLQSHDSGLLDFSNLDNEFYDPS